ncbi:LuxR C-terminal-related transcriptional regulator [Clavibacter zhangzhiyongii]|uniref:helix-turn-helix transcriptional regulator n=1 Tax=Clavibacter zhangzhiyongii TaxID=2768071 RepID=UPI0039DF528D
MEARRGPQEVPWPTSQTRRGPGARRRRGAPARGSGRRGARARRVLAAARRPAPAPDPRPLRPHRPWSVGGRRLARRRHGGHAPRLVRGRPPGVAPLPLRRRPAAHRRSAAPPVVRAAVLVHRAAGDRRVGQLAEARASVAEARRILDTERGIPLSAPASRCRRPPRSSRGWCSPTSGRSRPRATSCARRRRCPSATWCGRDRLECRGALAYVAYCLGEVAEAEDLVRQARELLSDDAAGAALARSGFRAPAEIAAALIAVDATRRDEARVLLDDLRPACAGTDWELLGCYAEATVDAIRGLRLDALDHLRRLHNLGTAWQEHGPLPVMRDVLRASLLAHLGQTAAAWDLLRTVAPTEHHSTCPAMVAGRLRVLADDHTGALAEVAGCLALGDGHSGRTLVDVLLVVAAAHRGLGDHARSDHALRSGGAAGDDHVGHPPAVRGVPGHRHDGAARPGAGTRPAARRAPDDGGDARRVRAERVPVPTPSRVDPLSERERAIVACLAEGLTVAGIAARLFISPNTVKSHVRSAYRKLDASTRAEAVDRARALGHDLRPGSGAWIPPGSAWSRTTPGTTQGADPRGDRRPERCAVVRAT